MGIRVSRVTTSRFFAPVFRKSWQIFARQFRRLAQADNQRHALRSAAQTALLMPAVNQWRERGFPSHVKRAAMSCRNSSALRTTGPGCGCLAAHSLSWTKKRSTSYPASATSRSLMSQTARWWRPPHAQKSAQRTCCRDAGSIQSAHARMSPRSSFIDATNRAGFSRLAMPGLFRIMAARERGPGRSRSRDPATGSGSNLRALSGRRRVTDGGASSRRGSGRVLRVRGRLAGCRRARTDFSETPTAARQQQRSRSRLGPCLGPGRGWRRRGTHRRCGGGSVRVPGRFAVGVVTNRRKQADGVKSVTVRFAAQGLPCL
jgi:hypothetical protein